jgi:hypothetical protein
MKKLIIAIITVVFMFSVSFANAGVDCEKIEKLARAIMEKRQDGYQMSTLMGVMNKNDNEAAKNILKIMIIDAYDYPNYSTVEMERETITEFGNKYYKHCVEQQ